MIINENSWHFKIYAAFNSTWNRPKTLCAYFWKTLIPVLAASIIGFAILAAVTIIGQEILTKFFVFSSLWTLVPASIGVGVLFIALCVGISIVLVLGIPWLIDLYRERKYYKEVELIAQNQERIKNGLEPIERKKSLIGEYLKARKEKVCPTLEYKAK
ncbi:membrane protein [Escherichia phage phiE142]|uniref:Signal-peptide domain-containing protein n=1 Tax=Escherichia phage phiE142 TaxID=1777059 RepID=A0A0U4JUY5_9CAUD|nr:membrane protein [Escherichia phage phiE142]ALY07922.1 hypothetical protein phiE142_117 [Escherichia phage phiE142]